ncbi:MAG TPA: hypothetical protein VJG31_03540 [Candidatus Nanoarchaeia archaeon]|nr:hypothetical protein [Candidatus Nanoarchaeia archaeon]
MNRKAASVLLMVVEILAVIFLAFISLKMAQAAANQSSLEKINLAQDLVLSVNTLVSFPGEGFLQYPLNDRYNLSEYIFSLTDGGVTTKSKPEEELGSVTRRLSLPQGYTAFGEMSYPEKFYLVKEGKKIYLSGDMPALRVQREGSSTTLYTNKIIFAPAGETADLISAIVSTSLAKETKSSPEEGALYLFFSETSLEDTLKIEYSQDDPASQALAIAVFNQAQFVKKELLPTSSSSGMIAALYITFPFGEAAKIAIPLEKALKETVKNG